MSWLTSYWWKTFSNPVFEFVRCLSIEVLNSLTADAAESDKAEDGAKATPNDVLAQLAADTPGLQISWLSFAMVEDYLAARTRFCTCLLEESVIGIRALKLDGSGAGNWQAIVLQHVEPTVAILSKCFDDVAAVDCSKLTRLAWVEFWSGLLLKANILRDLAASQAVPIHFLAVQV